MFRFVHRLYVFTSTLLILSVVNKGGYTTVADEGLKPLPRSFNPFVNLGENSYFIGLFEKVNWYQAAHICSFQDMALASFSSKKEYDLLRKFLSDNDILDAQYWLSANDLAKQHDFYWLADGHPLTFTNWSANQMIGQPFNKRCVRTGPTFEWAVHDCNDRVFYFICSYPEKPVCGFNNNCKRRW